MTGQQPRPEYAKQSIRGLLILALLFVVVVLLYVDVKHDRRAKHVQTTHYDHTLNHLPLQRTEPLAVTTLHPGYHAISSCNMAFIDGQNFNKTIDITNDTSINLGGWLINSVSGTNPTDAWIIMDGLSGEPSYQSKILLRSRADDVQQAFGNNLNYAYAGFISQIDSTQMAAGKYHLYIVFLDGNKLYTCDNGRKIAINAKN